MKQKPAKRDDLQGIRGIAIVAVLGFHFYPEWCPNGYLGVDQFFVLSGFLMCMLLQRASQEEPCSLLGLFYSRRFKRILPLYLLLIGLSLLALYSFFPDTAVETNQESAVYALLFMSNRPKTDQEDYFQMMSIAVDIFTHTWSLSVEIQFYLIIPVIFLFGRKLSQRSQYIFYGVLASCSFVFFSISSKTVAFNNVFARIWQFVVGMIVHFLTISKNQPTYKILQNEEDCEALLGDGDNEDTEDLEMREPEAERLSAVFPFFVYFLLVAVIIVAGIPVALPAVIVRPIVTIGTGILMLVSEGNAVLSNRILTYIGDISYSLYLVHWPIYAYWKLTQDGDQTKLAIALVSSIIIAAVTHETFEKWYLRLSSTNIGVLVIVLFLFNVGLIHKSEMEEHARLDGVTANMTYDDAAKLNSRWTSNDNKNLISPTCDYENKKGPFGWCRHTGLSPNGKYKLEIIGNSWNSNHATMFYQECHRRANSIIQGAAYGCEPLFPSDNSTMCNEEFKNFVERLRVDKPDFAFIFTRYFSIGLPLPKNVTSYDEDPIYQIMKNQTRDLLASIKYKLYILDAIPRMNSGYLGQVPGLLKKGTNRTEIDNKLTEIGTYEIARKRHAQLVKDFNGRVVLVDYLPEFYNNATGTFQFVDEKGFSYFTGPNHLSPHGLEHVRHVWTDICREL